MTLERSIRSVAVVGGGIVGLSAAIAFARALCGAKIRLITTKTDPSAVADLAPTSWPGVTRFHHAIGIDEIELVGSGTATYHLGTIIENWSPSGTSWVHALGATGKPVGAIPFDQIWCRAEQVGEALDYDRYSLAAALIAAGKFVHPAKDPQFLGSRFEYALRLDPERYRERLAGQAKACAVETLTGEIEDVEPGPSGVRALLLSGGHRVEADFFLDCTGPTARVLSALDDSFEDWSQWMPLDRLLVESGARAGLPAIADRVRATDEGWSIDWQLPERTMRATLRAAGEGLPISRGRRLRPFVRNVLALGDAAVALDPLHGMGLDLAHRMILLALELLPGRDFPAAETDEYNRRAEQLTRRVRDFIALHYLRSGRQGDPWSVSSAQDLPDSLALSLDQYEYRGRLPFHEEESVSRDSWASVLIGLGIRPGHVDPQVAEVPLERASAAMSQLAHEIDALVARLPSYADYLGQLRG